MAYKTIKTGSTLTINNELTIPAYKARVHMQSGKVVLENEIDFYYPNCSVEVRTIKKVPQKILPDVFTIKMIKTDEELTGISGRTFARFGGQYDGSASHENMITHFYITSNKQPDIFRLSCQHWEDPTDSRHLTVSEVNATLGDYVTF
ncbi:MAG: hypothetical protein P8Y24_04520 [Gammaproteobacteria bacterium]